MFALIRYTHVGNLLSTLGRIRRIWCRLALVPRSYGPPPKASGELFCPVGATAVWKGVSSVLPYGGGCLSETPSVRNSYQVTFKVSSTLKSLYSLGFSVFWICYPYPLRLQDDDVPGVRLSFRGSVGVGGIIQNIQNLKPVCSRILFVYARARGLGLTSHPLRVYKEL